MTAPWPLLALLSLPIFASVACTYAPGEQDTQGVEKAAVPARLMSAVEEMHALEYLPYDAAGGCEATAFYHAAELALLDIPTETVAAYGSLTFYDPIGYFGSWTHHIVAAVDVEGELLVLDPSPVPVLIDGKPGARQQQPGLLSLEEWLQAWLIDDTAQSRNMGKLGGLQRLPGDMFFSFERAHTFPVSNDGNSSRKRDFVKKRIEELHSLPSRIWGPSAPSTCDQRPSPSFLESDLAKACGFLLTSWADYLGDFDTMIENAQAQIEFARSAATQKPARIALQRELEQRLSEAASTDAGIREYEEKLRVSGRKPSEQELRKRWRQFISERRDKLEELNATIATLSDQLANYADPDIEDAEGAMQDVLERKEKFRERMERSTDALRKRSQELFDLLDARGYLKRDQSDASSTGRDFTCAPLDPANLGS